MKKYCLALDLKDDPKLIAEYKKHHEGVWQGITNNIKAPVIEHAEIHCAGNRLLMILEVNDSFSNEKKSIMT
ncbi:L-rhamnose mutarotase [Aestuariivivens sediminis]|uniref:L-rhamnose mutarotase n=1 Tax=Aestuariivivens sediminis TaxID=2913557 RepID=UPI001F5AF047|nr:L-rhamnose mutarotase [Aestuariivivens sediminis]